MSAVEALDIDLVAEFRSSAVTAIGKFCTNKDSIYFSERPARRIIRGERSKAPSWASSGLAGVLVILDETNMHIRHTSDNHISVLGGMVVTTEETQIDKIFRIELPPPGFYEDTMIYDVTLGDRCTPLPVHTANYNPLLDAYLRLLESELCYDK